MIRFRVKLKNYLQICENLESRDSAKLVLLKVGVRPSTKLSKSEKGSRLQPHRPPTLNSSVYILGLTKNIFLKQFSIKQFETNTATNPKFLIFFQVEILQTVAKE